MLPIGTRLCYGVISWGMGNLPVAILLKKSSSATISCSSAGGGARTHWPLPLALELLPGLVLCGSCVGHHSCSEFMCAAAVWCQEASFSPHFAISSASSILSSPSCMSFPEPGQGLGMVINVSLCCGSRGRRTYSQHFEQYCFSAFNTTRCSQKLL